MTPPSEAPLRSLEEALVLGEALRDEMRSLLEERAVLQRLLEEYRRALEVLTALKETSAGDEILVPVGGGSFLRVIVPDPSKVLSSLGSGVAAEKSTESARQLVEANLKNIEEALRRVLEEGQRLESEYAALAEEIRKIQSAPSPQGR